MKKRIYGIILLTVICLSAFFLFACEGQTSDVVNESDLVLYYLEDANGTREQFEESDAYDSQKGQLDITLGEDVSVYDFNAHFKNIAQKTRWSLYTDAMGQNEIPTKMVDKFSNGENMFYITVSALDDSVIKNYVVRIYKEYSVNITFKQINGDNYVAGGEIFSDFLNRVGATWTSAGVYTIPGDTVLQEVPQGPEVIGYTFDGWYCGDEAAKDMVLTRDIDFVAKYTAKDIVFTLDANGGDLGGQPASVTLKFDQEHQLPVPVRTGYSFAGWRLTRDNNMLTDATGKTLGKLAIADNSALVAEWTKNSYLLSFITDSAAVGKVVVTTTGGEQTFVPSVDGTGEGQSIAYEENMSFEVVPDATYTFVSLLWRQEGAGEDAWTPVEGDAFVMPAYNVEIKVVYSHLNVVVSGNEKGQGVIEGEGYYTAGTSVTLTAAANPGYKFVAWTNGEQRVTDAEYTFVMPSESVVVNIEWQPVTIVATLQPGNGEGNLQENITYDASYTLTVPERYGYDFTGWMDEGGRAVTNESGVALEVSKFTDNVVLTAGWKAKQVTVSFALNGGNGGPEFAATVADFDDTIDLPTPTRTGYNFVGWHKSGESEMFDGKIDTTEDFTLEAQWTPVVVNINLHMTKGDAGYDSKQATYDARVELGTPQKEGYTFTGWIKSEDDEPLTGADGVIEKSTFTADADVYAGWKAITVTVTYIPGEGATISADTQQVTYGERANLLIPLYEGHIFAGWLYNGELICGSDGIVESVKFTQDVQLTAKWSTYNIRVTLNANGGQLDVAEAEIIFGQSFKLPVPTRDGYVFVGWQLENAMLTDAQGNSLAPSSISSPVTLTAVWEAADIKITLNANQGTLTTPGTVQTAFGATQVALGVPTRVGYTFAGWKNGNNLVTGSDGILAEVTFAGDTTLTAEWTPVTYSVTLQVEGGTASGNTVSGGGRYSHNARVTVRATAAAGYYFLGWYDTNNNNVSNANPYTFTINRDITLVARFISGATPITNADGLKNIQADGDYILTGNITLTGEWTPLLFDGGFTGSFDGNGYTISGLKITKEPYAAGDNNNFALFDTIGEGGVVKNLKVNADIKVITNFGGNKDFIAAIIAGVNNGLIENCSADGSITVAPYISGNAGGYINIDVGGICGQNYGDIKYCSSYLKIDVSDNATRLSAIGAICGTNETGALIVGCYADAEITAKNTKVADKFALNVAQIAGTMEASTVQDCKADGSIKVIAIPEDPDSNTQEHNMVYIGGITGSLSRPGSEITRSIANTHMEADVAGNLYAGGIAAQSAYGTEITQCYVDIQLTATASKSPDGNYNACVGFISGQEIPGSTIENCYYSATSSINAKKDDTQVPVNNSDATATSFSQNLFTNTLGFGQYSAGAQDHGNNVWIITSTDIKLFIEK